MQLAKTLPEVPQNLFVLKMENKEKCLRQQQQPQNKHDEDAL